MVIRSSRILFSYVKSNESFFSKSDTSIECFAQHDKKEEKEKHSYETPDERHDWKPKSIERKKIRKTSKKITPSKDDEKNNGEGSREDQFKEIAFFS